MRVIALLLVCLCFTGCATPVPRQASIVEYQVSGKSESAFKKVGQSLLTNGFSIVHTDSSVGVLKAQRDFVIQRGLLKVGHPGRVAVQLMLSEDNKIKSMIQYECQYGYGFQTCVSHDQDANAAIAVIESDVKSQLEKALAGRDPAKTK